MTVAARYSPVATRGSNESGDFRLWHETDMPTTLRDVRFQRQSGKHKLPSSSSAFDPKPTCGREQSTPVPAGQPLAFHAPGQEVDAVLAEERLLLEHESRHAPMPRGGMVLFIGRDHRLESVGIGLDRLVHCGEVKPRTRGGPGERATLVPALRQRVPQ